MILRHDERVPRHARRGLMATVAAIGLFHGPQALARAQPQSSTELEEVVVTGSFSTSLEDALRIKRAADSISDSVSASDIGNFPAVNVAEALQRVPGVTISREAGEGQFVSVRGLGPNFCRRTSTSAPAEQWRP